MENICVLCLAAPQLSALMEIPSVFVSVTLQSIRGLRLKEEHQSCQPGLVQQENPPRVSERRHLSEESLMSAHLEHEAS